MKQMRTLAAVSIFALIALAVILQAGDPATSQAQIQPAPPAMPPAPLPGKDTLFPETGYSVPAVFMDYWQSHGGVAIFGYPISPMQSEAGYQVQYFERNRFEYHPENKPTGNEVQLGLLGAYLTADRHFPVGDPIQTTGTQTYFTQTGHSLGGIFYSYWLNNGALALFGYPISEQLTENGHTVQYFQRNRFEYHPEHAGTPYAVQLGLLGTNYLALLKNGLVIGGGGGVAGGLTSSATTPAPPNTTGPTAVPVLTVTPFLKGPHIGYGMIVHMFYQDHTRVLNAVKDIGFNWVKQQVQWADMESPKGTYHFEELDRIVNDTNAAGVSLMLSVVRTPQWATAAGIGLPDDPSNFQDFMTVLSARYAGRVKAYEIWNEENLGNETGPAHYHADQFAEVLKAGFLGTRVGDPNAIVISGALAPTGVYNDAAVEDTYFLDQLYQWHNGEIRNYYDVLGMHPYGYWNPPDSMFPVKQPSDQTPASAYNNHGSFYFRRIEDQRAVMEKHGEAGKQIWLTEFGWCSDKRDGGYVECINNSLDDQAAYEVRAYQKAQQDYPYMGVMFLWNLNFSTFQEWYSGPSHFSILNPDWSPRPAYWALKNMPKP
ncbi:MAG: cellulase family glycosylhydrolase [Chloroflexia bacterium]